MLSLIYLHLTIHHQLFTIMTSIHLQNLQFFAHHGLYEAERVSGNHFELDVDIETNIDGPVDKLSQTVDYVAVYSVIEKRMQQPTALLETLAQDLAKKIYATDSRIKKISIRIDKIFPPIANFKGKVGVTYTKAF
jgi:7,8-dihydroneopterin aldolase/epimerase/oxygenase